MRLLALFRKTMIENVRDWKILVMTLTFAPFFVVLMYLYFEEATVTYRITVVNHDAGPAGAALVERLGGMRTEEGASLVRVREEHDAAAARGRIRDRSADLVVEIPADFTAGLLAYAAGSGGAPVTVRTYGDRANANYLLAMAFSDYLAFDVASRLTGIEGPIRLETVDVGAERSQDAFGRYVPGLLSLALIMLMFTAAASVIKEKDKGTLVRLRLSNMTTLEWLAAVSAGQCLIGLVAVGLTILTAMALGYRPMGSLGAAGVVTLVSSLAIMGISMLVAAWLRTIFDLVTVGTFPFFLLMFFSGGMFPLPDIEVLTVAGRGINVNDVLPTTHAIAAYDRILTENLGLGAVGFELVAITLLATLFFAAGTWWFTRRHMRG